MSKNSEITVGVTITAGREDETGSTVLVINGGPLERVTLDELDLHIEKQVTDFRAAVHKLDDGECFTVWSRPAHSLTEAIDNLSVAAARFEQAKREVERQAQINRKRNE